VKNRDFLHEKNREKTKKKNEKKEKNEVFKKKREKQRFFSKSINGYNCFRVV
jgi:hypothetical protein